MEKPHISIKLPDNLPEEAIKKITSGIENDKLELKIHKTPLQFYAAVELTIPALIAIFIAQNYFGGFIKEIGKEHYLILKDWLKNNAIKTRAIKATKITSDRSPEKLKNSHSQSEIFSIHFKTKNEKSLKVLFDL